MKGLKLHGLLQVDLLPAALVADGKLEALQQLAAQPGLTSRQWFGSTHTHSNTQRATHMDAHPALSYRADINIESERHLVRCAGRGLGPPRVLGGPRGSTAAASGTSARTRSRTSAATPGLGRIADSYHRASTSYHTYSLT